MTLAPDTKKYVCYTCWWLGGMFTFAAAGLDLWAGAALWVCGVVLAVAGMRLHDRWFVPRDGAK